MNKFIMNFVKFYSSLIYNSRLSKNLKVRNKIIFYFDKNIILT